MKGNIKTFSQIHLDEDSDVSEVEVLRTGVIQDRGFKITPKMLKDFVKNYKDDVYGTEIQVNMEHKRGSEAVGWVQDLFVKGKRLYAEVEWTILGKDKIKNKLYKFVSAELASEYPHHKTGDLLENVFIGLALTNTPALKGQKALALSEIINQEQPMFKKILQMLKEKAFVSKEEKQEVSQMFATLSEEEQVENAAAMEEVEAKPEAPEQPEGEEGAEGEPEGEEPPEGEEKEEESGEEEAPEGEGEPEGEEPAGDQELAEKSEVVALKERVASLEKEKLQKELSETVESLMLSENNNKGFVKAEHKDKLVSLLTNLSNENRAGLLELLASIVEVELGEKGSVNVPKPKAEGETAELAELHKEAEALSEKEGISKFDALNKLILERETKSIQ